jgi:hypothetical protein
MATETIAKAKLHCNRNSPRSVVSKKVSTARGFRPQPSRHMALDHTPRSEGAPAIWPRVVH